MLSFYNLYLTNVLVSMMALWSIVAKLDGIVNVPRTTDSMRHGRESELQRRRGWSERSVVVMKERMDRYTGTMQEVFIVGS